MLYLIGRLGRQIPVVARRLDSPRLRGLRERLPRLLVVGRFLVGMRTFLFLAAGASEIPLARFVVCDLVAASLSVPLLVAAGRWLGPAIERVWPALMRFEAALVCLLPLWLLFSWRRARREYGSR
jgi:membrane protein DedA with SNARE-associated domain